MNGVGPAWRSRAAQALLGPDRSPLVPSTLWVGWLDASDALIAMTGTSYPTSAFGPFGDGVANTAVLDGGVAVDGWPSIAAVALYDAPGGDVVVAAVLPAPVSPAADEPLSFPVGSLAFVTVDGA